MDQATIDRMMADKDLPFVHLVMSHDFEGVKRPLVTYKMVGGKEIKVKAVQDPHDTQKFIDYYQKDTGEWAQLLDDEPGSLYIRGIGSSEVKDCDGDIMHKSALTSMCNVEPGLNTWIGHNVDDDHLFGSLTESPKMTYRDAGSGIDGPLIKANKGYAAVEICSDVETESARAMRSYRYMKKGRQFGFSVGCFYTKFDKRVEKGRVVGADVYEVAVIEWSVVPMPNNQQSWVEATHKALVRKGFLVDESLRSNENLYRIDHFDHFPDLVGSKMKNLQDYLKQANLCIATVDPALAGIVPRSS